LDLDDYNKEVEEGCHITSMAGTGWVLWKVLVECELKTIRFIFPKIPKEWKGYSFKINFRNQILTVAINHKETIFSIDGNQEIAIVVNGQPVLVNSEHCYSIIKIVKSIVPSNIWLKACNIKTIPIFIGIVWF
jgi:maltose phosphorylase